MFSSINLPYEVPQIFHALYWILMDVFNALEEAKNKTSGGLKLHLTLASKRCGIIVEHLKIALEESGIKPDERLEEEEMRRRIGTLPMDALENVKNTIKRIIGEFSSDEKCEASWLSSKLVELADIISIASCLLKIYLEDLRGSNDERIWKTCLILRVIICDLEIIENTHRYLASNPEMLIKNLKQ